MPLLRRRTTTRGDSTPAPVRRGLHASAQRVNLKGRTVNLGKPTEWQAENAGYFDIVGEVKQLTWLQGNVMAKCRWYVGVRDPNDPEATPVPVSDPASGIDRGIAARAQAELARLKGPLGGISEIARSMNMNFDITGEVNLVGRAERVMAADSDSPGQTIPEEWSACSVFEIKSEGTGRSKTVKLRASEQDQGEKLDLDHDAVIRIWQHHPLWKNQADCSLRGAQDQLETLVALRNQVKATARSKIPAGWVTMPNELSFGPANATEGEDGEEAATDPFEKELIDALIDPIEDPGAASAYAPTLLRGPAEFLAPDYVRRITFERTDDATLAPKIEACVQAIARALNAPVEKVMGSQQTTFANAAVIKQDEFDEHLEPRCVLIADALTVAFLHPNLLDTAPNDQGVATRQAVPQNVVDLLCVWYDPSAMVAQPDLAEKVEWGVENNVLSWEAGRRIIGASEDDKPSEDEMLLKAQLAAVRAPAQVTTTEDQPLAIAASARPSKRSNPGRKLMLIDRELRSKLQTAASAALTRVLERAGNRLRSATPDNARLTKGLDAGLVARQLGPALVADAGLLDDDLIPDSAFTELERQFYAWGAGAQQQALDTVNQLIGLSTAQREALQLRQAGDLSEAWGWMRDALHQLAKARLFDPDPLAPSIGEFDPTSKVPTGLIRQALARAGGANGLTVVGGDPFVVLNNGNPPGGIGTGELTMGALKGADVLVEGYEWVYGPAHRQAPFEEHLDLDGVQFADWDADVLSGSVFDSNWYPGDHAGCFCDVVPQLILPADLED